MNISSRFLSQRTVRSALLAVALAVAIGFLVLGDTVGTKVLGAVGALLVALLIKVVSELFVLLSHLERVTSQLALGLEQSANSIRTDLARAMESQAHLEEAAMQIGSALTETGEAQQQALQRIEYLEQQGAEVKQNLETLRSEMDALTTTQRSVRRHEIRADLDLRELALRESLDGLSTGDAAASE